MTEEQPQTRRRSWLLFALWALVGVLVIGALAGWEALSTPRGKRWRALLPHAFHPMTAIPIAFPRGTPPEFVTRSISSWNERLRAGACPFAGVRDRSVRGGGAVVEYVVADVARCPFLGDKEWVEIRPPGALSFPDRLRFVGELARLDAELVVPRE